jgi:hypothetical protein
MLLAHIAIKTRMDHDNVYVMFISILRVNVMIKKRCSPH